MNSSISTYSITTLIATTTRGIFGSPSSTGKEKDFESGYHYFGARYYDSEALTGWLSVDPMSDKYPSMSPYNYCHWNPTILIDPDGNEDDNYYIFGGQIYKETTNDETNSYYFVEEGDIVSLGTYEKVTNENNEDLVKIGNSATGKSPTGLFSWVDIKSGNLYYEEDAFALFLGATYLFKKTNMVDVQVNQFMSINKGHSSSKEGRCASIDIAYFYDSGKPNAKTYDKSISQSLNQEYYDLLKAFGLGSTGSFSNIPVDYNKPYNASKGSGKPFLVGTTAAISHHHHFHLEGFSKKRIMEIF